jgi:hypothetical protein
MSRKEIMALVDASTTIPRFMQKQARDVDMAITKGMTVREVREALIATYERLSQELGYTTGRVIRWGMVYHLIDGHKEGSVRLKQLSPQGGKRFKRTDRLKYFFPNQLRDGGVIFVQEATVVG